MRVENGAVNGPAPNLYTGPMTKTTQNRGPAVTASRIGADKPSLSDANELISLAKSTMPADRMAHFQALSAMVNSGRYDADSAATSQALVDEHLNSSKNER